MPFLGKTPSQIVDPEVDIDGGTIDGVSIGSVTANAGAFTNLTATGTITFPDDGISGDDIAGGTATLDGLAVGGAVTVSRASSDSQLNLIRTGSNSANGWIWANSNKIRFGDDNSGNPNNTRMCVTTDTGRVGIGTTSPAASLHVSETSSGLTARFSNESNQTLDIGTVSGSGASGSVYFDNPNSGNVQFRTGGTERMRVDSSGNTVAKPSGGEVTLGANGHITSKQSLDVATAGGRYIGASNRGTVGQIRIEQTTTSADGGYVSFDTCASGSTSPTERMRIDASGNVGIGTESPSYKLDVDVGAPASQDQLLGRFSSQAGTRSIAFVWDDSASTLGIGTQTNHPIAFHINGSSAERLRIDTYGGLNIKSVAGTQAATFGGSNLVNGITALPSSAGTPFVVGRDTGTTRSAHFAGHLRFDAGYGIDFSSTANTGGMSSEVFDDYEEGTFTMGMQSSGNDASLSIGNQTAYYTKIGNLVTFTWYSTGCNITAAGSGYVVLSGFPFVSSNAGSLYGLLHTSHCTVANTDGGYIQNNSTVGYLVQQHSTSGASFNTGNPRYIMVQGFYYTA